MSNCIWKTLTKGSRCVRCGYPLPRDFKHPPVLNCESRNRKDIQPRPVLQTSFFNGCIHLGEGAGNVKVQCGPNRSSIYPVFQCALHDRCVPTFQGPWDQDHQTEAALYHLCGPQRCNDYQSKE